MAADIKSQLAAGRFHIPAEEQCAQLQAYWDDLAEQRKQVSISLGAAEPSISYAPWRAEDD